MTIDEYMDLLDKIATENNLDLTDNAFNIARFRARTQLPISVCPCEQGAKNRGCIGEKCWDEINKDGKCLCNCFRKRVN